MRLAGALFVSVLMGCAENEMHAEAPCARTVAESPPDAELQPLADDAPPAPAVADSFDLHTAREEATRPRPRITRSVSLGYIGDGPLSGGVMRDDYVPMPQALGPTWQTYIRRGSWGRPGGYSSYPAPRPYQTDPRAYGYYR